MGGADGNQSAIGTNHQRPARVGGAAVLRGTRLSVVSILRLLASGATVEEILWEYEGLTPEDTQACLLFAAEMRK